MLAFGSQVAGCAGVKKDPTRTDSVIAGSSVPLSNSAPEMMGPPEAMGPEPVPAPAAPSEQPVYGPEQIQIRPVTLVLGPGMARGFAFVGAIRALSDAKIPIGAIIGTEMGALVGALYALDSNANHLEWALQKFKESVFLSEKDLIPTHKFDRQLEQIFATKEFQQLRIPLHIGIEMKQSRRWLLADKGLIREAVRASVATPELFSPSRWNGAEGISAARSRPYPVLEARKLAGGPVIVIDVLDPKDSAPFAELKEADLIIQPEMGGIGPMDFAKRTEASFRGKRAVQNRIAEIKRWVGMPQGEP